MKNWDCHICILSLLCLEEFSFILCFFFLSFESVSLDLDKSTFWVAFQLEVMNIHVIFFPVVWQNAVTEVWRPINETVLMCLKVAYVPYVVEAFTHFLVSLTWLIYWAITWLANVINPYKPVLILPADSEVELSAQKFQRHVWAQSESYILYQKALMSFHTLMMLHRSAAVLQ